MEFRNKHAFISNNEHFSLIYDAFSTNPHNCAVLFASFFLFVFRVLLSSRFILFLFSSFFEHFVELIFILIQPKCQLSHFVFPLICFFFRLQSELSMGFAGIVRLRLLWHKVRTRVFHYLSRTWKMSQSNWIWSLWHIKLAKKFSTTRFFIVLRA